jgi:hypothetical protein
MRRPNNASIALSLIILYVVGTFLLSIKLLDHDDQTKDWTSVVLQQEQHILHGMPKTNIMTASTTVKQRHATNRFPKYGTPDFMNQCSYAAHRGNAGNCTIHVQPPQFGMEGIGNWIPQIVSGHLLAIQLRCDLRFGYGKSVNISHALTLPSPFTQQDWNNWTIPSVDSNDCKVRCYVITLFTVMSSIIPFFGGDELATTPYYRYTYNQNYTPHNLSPFNATPLEEAIPGYQVETGFACSLGWLFHLSPTASNYEPRLFDSILQMLNQDDDALVIAVYLRTGETDVVAKLEEQESNVVDATTTIEQESQEGYRVQAQYILNCTMHQEQEYLNNNVHLTNVVWLVVTDSHDLKQWIVDTYNDTAIPMSPSRPPIHRHVVTTRARGVHTRSKRGPKTADFAEAMMDWYLIGESDLVILDNGGPSFGGTAALRTNRPVYHALPSDQTCIIQSKPKFVYFDENKAHLRQCLHIQSIKQNLSPMCLYLLGKNGALK